MSAMSMIRLLVPIIGEDMKIRIDSLDTLFSLFIRLRAMKRVDGCERCLAGKTSYKQLQCSHYIKRRNKSTRWDEDNCAGLCFGCHQYFDENNEEYEQWMINHIGQDRLDMLNSRKRIIFPKPDKEAIELYLREQLKNLTGTL